MENIKSMICTRCGSHHLEKISETEYKCANCDAIITKEKAVNFEKEYKRLLEEGKNIDIANLRSLVKKSLYGRVNKNLLCNTCEEILKILPNDTVSLFYLKYVNRNIDSSSYEKFLDDLITQATITEMNEIIDIIVKETRVRDKDKVIKVVKHFYNDKYDDAINNALIQRQKEVELFSDIPRDIFICHSSQDYDKVENILNVLESDGYTCWISSRNIPWDSDNYWANITKAIKSCDIFLCINSINVMDSSDCRKEVEIAKELNKKRIEYKLDNAKDITLFKLFFTGQWITNHDDLLIKVYNLKNKESKTYCDAINLLNDKKYNEAKEMFASIKSYNDSAKYLDLCDKIIKSLNYINNGLHEEAKYLLLQVDDIEYVKEYLILINSKLEVNTKKVTDNIDNNNVINKIKMRVDFRKEYDEAKEEIMNALENDYNNYDLWYYYLKSITKGFKNINLSDKYDDLSFIFDNLNRLATSDKIEELHKLNMQFNSQNEVNNTNNEEEINKKEGQIKPVGLNNVNKNDYNDEKIENENQESKNKNLEEEKQNYLKKLEEEKIEQERAKKVKEEKANKEKIKNANVGDIIEFGFYPQTIKADKVAILDNNIDANGYYTGDDGEKYALLKAKPFNSMPLASYFSNGEIIINNKEYFFKVEPIKWKVLKRIDGKVLLFSDILLDVCEFDGHSNNYETSQIRKWLNKEFYKKAFNTNQKKLIETTLVDNSKNSLSNDSFDLFGDSDDYNKDNEFLCNNTNDKLFLLSEKEKDDYLPESYNLETIQITTDFSLANGAYDFKRKGTYWLRTPFNQKFAATIVDYNLSSTKLLTRKCVVSYNHTCVAPAMWIKL